MTAGTKRYGFSKFSKFCTFSTFSLFNRGSQDGEQATQPPQAGGVADRHTDPGQSARKRALRIVPVAGMAAALVAGATAYGLVASSGHPQAGDLSANMALPGSQGTATHAGVDSAASAKIRSGATAAHPAASASARPQASHPAKAAAKAKAAPSATRARAAATAKASSSAHPAVRPATAAPAPAAKTLSCNESDGMLPDNVTAIVTFLLAHGYSDNAAAGIAGNMYQESKGNPESEGMGGGGLIGFTPLPAGYVTGNAASDLQTQLQAVLAYNQQWSGYLPELNDAGSPADAASIYVTDFERAGIPAASTREASAEDVASACGI
ncbi:MAG TPA: phage tail tip lysozyme [Streptosporangiaceae bacterium]|nr:phage tail tip lysozyme [Streptosporangiaceae bacterium]